MDASSFRLRVGVVFYLATMAGASAQDAATASPVTATSSSFATQPVSPTFPSILLTLRQDQFDLAGQMQVLTAQGATPEQIDTWLEQNAAQFQAAQQVALALSAATPEEPLASITEIEIPDGATQELSDFLTTQGDLYNRYARLYNQQLASALGGAAGPDATDLFAQQNAAEIQGQQQRADVLAAQSEQQAIPVPPPLSLPVGIGAQMQAFLTLRDQLMRAEIKMHNQYVGSPAAAIDAAEQQWRQQNAASFQQLQQLAQNLSAGASN